MKEKTAEEPAPLNNRQERLDRLRQQHDENVLIYVQQEEALVELRRQDVQRREDRVAQREQDLQRREQGLQLREAQNQLRSQDLMLRQLEIENRLQDLKLREERIKWREQGDGQPGVSEPANYPDPSAVRQGADQGVVSVVEAAGDSRVNVVAPKPAEARGDTRFRDRARQGQGQGQNQRPAPWR